MSSGEESYDEALGRAGENHHNGYRNGIETSSQQAEAGPSRKRAREDGDYHASGTGGNPPSHNNAQGRQPHDKEVRNQQSANRMPHHQDQWQSVPIMPSIFGITPRNEFTKTIGDFIMQMSRGRDNIEVGYTFKWTRYRDKRADRGMYVQIEIKLGTLNAAIKPGEMPRRINLPTMSETR